MQHVSQLRDLHSRPILNPHLNLLNPMMFITISQNLILGINMLLQQIIDDLHRAWVCLGSTKAKKSHIISSYKSYEISHSIYHHCFRWRTSINKHDVAKKKIDFILWHPFQPYPLWTTNISSLIVVITLFLHCLEAIFTIMYHLAITVTSIAVIIMSTRLMEALLIVSLDELLSKEPRLWTTYYFGNLSLFLRKLE